MNKNPSRSYVAIGGSGSEGLDNLRELMEIWPTGLDVTVLAVLHRPSGHVSYLADILRRSSSLPVEIASNGQLMGPGICYLGTPDAILTLGSQGEAQLIDGRDDKLRNRTVDELYKSVALHAGNRSVAILLSGALDDGSRGTEAVHHAGGLTFVLEPGAKPKGMQQNAIDFDGPISYVGSLPDIAELLRVLLPASNGG